MFREMRRIKQEMSMEDIDMILKENTSGVLAVLGDNEYPYAVPLSYVYEGDKLYFHCAKQGHKLDAIKKSSKASFCVIALDDVLPEEYTTRYRSVIVFGQAFVIENDLKKKKALERIAEKYDAGDIAIRKKAIDDYWDHVCIVELRIEHMTGKCSM